MSKGGKYKYSRYSGLPLRYAGGKSLAVGYVIERIPVGVEKIVSPFFGGGSVEIACSKDLGMSVKGYDVFDILTNYWDMQIRHPVILADEIMKWEPSKERYEQVKQRLKLHWTGEQLIDNQLSLAAHYWFNHNLSYGPGFLGWMSSIYADAARFNRLVNKVRTFNCPRLAVGAAAFENSIQANGDAFLYCDPPYYLDGDSKMFRGIYPQRNFPVHHTGFNHERLRDLLHEHEGGFILSYNDCETIRRWYADFEISEVQWQYTLGQGETRIGKNRVEGGVDHVKKSHEILIVSV